MSMRLSVLGVTGLVLLASCAPAPTPAGLELTFENVDPVCIGQAILARFKTEGWRDRPAADESVVFERPARDPVLRSAIRSRGYDDVFERLTIRTSRPAANSVKLIISGAYVTNPGARTERAVDLAPSATVRADLDGIIEQGSAACPASPRRA